MSNHVYGFWEHHLPEWEAEGVETALGDRDFDAGEEPTANEFDFWFDQTWKAFDTLGETIRDYVMLQRFGPEEAILVGTDAGTYDVLETADSRRLAVIQLAVGSYQQLRVSASVIKNNALSTPEATKVRIIWSTAAVSAKTAEWIVYYKAVGTGESFNAGSFSSVTASAVDSAVAHGRVVTEISLPVLTRGKDLILEIGHRGDIDAIDNTVCVHRIEVI